MSPITAEEEDTMVMLTCIVSSKPEASLTWSKVKKGPILLSGQGNRLSYILRNISRNDTGTYRCEADNGIPDKDSKDIQLTINCK